MLNRGRRSGRAVEGPLVAAGRMLDALADGSSPTGNALYGVPRTNEDKRRAVDDRRRDCPPLRRYGISMKVKGRRALRRRPLLATAGSRVRFRCDSRPWV
jgi:hypothetical protein